MRKIYYLFLAAFLMPTLMFAQPPVNDNCSGAILIDIDGDAVIADNTDATIYGPHGSCFADSEEYGGEQTDGDVWFSITLSEAAILLIEPQEGSADDSQLALFAIENCGETDESYTEIACNEDGGWFEPMAEILTDMLEPGTYYLRASTWGDSNTGSFSISVSSVQLPENDTCEGAIELILDGPSEIADNTISSISGPSGSCYSISQVVGDTWFMFTTNEVMNIRIHTEDIDSENSQVSVFTIEGCGTENEVFTEIGCNDDMHIGTNMSQVNMYDLEPGTYYIKAGTYHEYFTGSYEVRLQSLADYPPNSDCANVDIQALEIDGAAASVTGTGINAADLAGIGQPHIWEAFTIDECADVTIDMCGTPVELEDYFLEIVKGCPLDNSVIAIENTDDYTEDCDGVQSVVITFEGLPAGTYYYPIMSSAYYSELDEYTVNFTAVSCEDDQEEDPVGISEADKTNFSVYPNPSNGQFTIGNVDVSGNYTIEIFDLAGRVIHSQESALNAKTEAKINLSDVAPGVYMVQMINTNDNTQGVQRIVIE